MKGHGIARGLLSFAFVVAVSVLAMSGVTSAGNNDFTFVQISDTHWGFNNPEINPDWQGTLKKIIAKVNAFSPPPDFVVFTGDLTQTTDDPQERRKRMKEFLQIVSALKVKDIKFLPGEHDAGLDNGAAFKENFGETHYSFDHKGVHFIAIDNVSAPSSSIGEEELSWLRDDLNKLGKDARIVVFTHRPLFDLYPDWDWQTRDGAKALELLSPFKNVAVFYGHIHQENEHLAGGAAFHAAMGTMYPLPAPGSVPKKAPVKWNPDQPYKGLGFRSVLVNSDTGEYLLREYPVAEAGDDRIDEVIKVSAKKFAYTPNEIRIKKNVPVTLEFTSQDVLHGFNCPGLGVRSDIPPGKTTLLRLVAGKAGVYQFHCDNFCGEGHGDMTGKIIVEE
jgi:heme/copper-type cytochrome/quinol oxidase subunit 2